MDYNFNKGQTLIVVLLSNDIIEGEYVDGCKNRINLANVTIYPSKKKVNDACCYYRCEISSIRVLDNKLSENNDLLSMKPLENGYYDHKNAKVIKMKECEYERLKLLSQQYEFMAQVDSRYYEAVEYLKNCENIGVACITVGPKKSTQLSLLVLSSWDQIYIFDVLAFNRKNFPVELKYLMESDVIQKVVHDSRLLVEVLFTCYDVKLTKIFDTQVADIIIRKNENNGILPENTKSLSECLSHYFNFPTTLLEKAQNVDYHKWGQRPLKSSRRYKAAQLGTYLLSIKNHLEMIILKKFYRAVDIYSRSLLQCTAIESQKNLKDTKLTDILSELDIKELSS